jgi:uncharacterized membrane protein
VEPNSSPSVGGPAPVTGRTRDLVIAIDRALLVISRHWLLYLNLVVLLYVGVPFLAPVFMHLGATGPAQAIYTFYSVLCHQLGFRSWYLFGEMSHYPRDVFQQFTGIDPNNPETGLLAARAFIGNAQVGYKVAFCERDVAIYGAVLLGGLIYTIPGVRRRVGPMPWIAYILIGVAPIALDGFSQLLSQYPYNLIPPFTLLPYRESTAFLRTLTGALFGISNAWLALPYLKTSMEEVRQELERKLGKVMPPRPLAV